GSWQLGVLGFRTRVVLHLGGPLQEAAQLLALRPDEGPEGEETDLVHLQAGVGLDAPAQIRTAPRSQPMASGRVPADAHDVPHGLSISPPRHRDPEGIRANWELEAGRLVAALRCCTSSASGG